MSLNPVQFGTQVIDQFGRYLLSQFPIAGLKLEEQIKGHHANQGAEIILGDATLIFHSV